MDGTKMRTRGGNTMAWPFRFLQMAVLLLA